MWAEAHWADAHIQLPEWSDYRADFSLLNGRVYPDTIAPNGSIDPFNPVTRRRRRPDRTARAPRAEVPAALVAGDLQRRRPVALRFANLGFREQAMTIAGIRMRVVGRDATPMRGRDGTDTSYKTDTLNIGPGESYDVHLHRARHQGPGAYDTYLLYNRAYTRSNNLAPGGFGGQATEIRVYPAAASAPRPIRTTGESERHDETIGSPHASGARQRGTRRALGRRAGARRGAASVTASPSPAGRGAAPGRHRLHQRVGGRRAANPIFNLTTRDRLHQPARRQHGVHVGLLERVRRRSSTPARSCASTRATPSP